MEFFGTHLKQVSQEVFKMSIRKLSLKKPLQFLLPYPPEASESTRHLPGPKWHDDLTGIIF